MKNIEIILRKLILHIYLFFKKNHKKQGKIELVKTDKILLIRLNKIGDALVTTHLIKMIKEKVGCTIHVLADKKNHFIFKNDKHVDQTIIFPKSFSEIKELKKNINNENYSALFDLHDDTSTTASLFIGMLTISNKIGYEKQTRKLFTHLVPYLDPKKYHMIERYTEYLKYMSIPYNKEKVRVNYHPEEESIKYANEFINNVFQEKKFLIGINISAGSSARFWGIENYKKLIAYFEQYNVNILLFASPNEIDLAKQIYQHDKRISAEPSYDRMTAVVKELDFLFSPDTSVVHIASAFKIPVFGIYINYNTDNVVWYPYNTEHELIITDKPNFNEMKFETVTNKLKPFFEKIYNGKRNTKL